MPPVGFEPTIAAGERPQTYALDRAATGTGLYFTYLTIYIRDTLWRSSLRHCATSWKVAGSIPDGVIEIFHVHNPSGRTTALGSTRPLTEMSARNISWGGKGGRCVGLTTLPPSGADCHEIWKPVTPKAFTLLFHCFFRSLVLIL